MSPRGRVFLTVALAAVLVSGAVVAGVLATRSDVPSVKPRKGLPSLALDLGVRTDPEARALRQALRLYQARRPKQAGQIFGRYSSLAAEVGAAFASWPGATPPAEEPTRRSFTASPCSAFTTRGPPSGSSRQPPARRRTTPTLALRQRSGSSTRRARR